MPTLGSQGKPALVSQGMPALVSQGMPALVSQGMPALVSQAQVSAETNSKTKSCPGQVHPIASSESLRRSNIKIFSSRVQPKVPSHDIGPNRFGKTQSHPAPPLPLS